MFTILDQRKQDKKQWLQDPKHYRCSKQRRKLDGSSGSEKSGMK